MKRWLQLGLLSVAILASYNNCSKGFNTSTSEDFASKSDSLSPGGVCEDSLLNLYQRGYYPFLKTNCTTCHTNDPGTPQFASNDVKWAYNVFMDKGYTRVSDNAINPNHNPPYSGVQHTQTVNELRLEWQQGITEYNSCKGVAAINDTVDPAELLTLETTQKSIPTLAVDESATIQWDLTSQLEIIKNGGVLPSTPGAKFSILVTRHKTQGGADYYVFTNPYIFGSSVDVHVKTLYVKVNGRLMNFPTTFKFLDASIRSPSGQDSSGLISTGGQTTPGAISNLDMVSIAFETIEATQLPPLPIPVKISFNGAKVYFVDSATGLLNLSVALNQGAPEPVTFSVQEDGAAFCGSTDSAAEVTLGATCLPEVHQAMVAQGLGDAANLKVARARSVVGPSFNRYDWDYKMEANALTFSVNSAAAIGIPINFSKDIRKETNRVLRLVINLATNNAVLGTQSKIYVVVKKVNNPTPATGEITYSKLMRSFGVFNTYCLKCHNSVDFKGNYDITNYDLMTANNVIIPFSTSSKMLQRINANNPLFDSLKGMPGTGGLEQAQIDIITEWILKGAKNN